MSRSYRRQPFGFDVLSQPGLDFEVGARAKIEGFQLGRAFAHAVGNILAGDNQFLVNVVIAAQDDVGVGMAGIEMVHRNPIELCPEILFHLRHQPAHERLEVGILGAVFG